VDAPRELPGTQPFWWPWRGAAQIQLIRYESVRDPSTPPALRAQPAAFGRGKPYSQHTWFIAAFARAGALRQG